MAAFNIYGHDNGEDSEPLATVTLSDDNAQILSVTSLDPADQEDVEKSLKFYTDNGFSPADAMFQYAGSYGMVKSAVPDEAAPSEAEAVEA